MNTPIPYRPENPENLDKVVEYLNQVLSSMDWLDYNLCYGHVLADEVKADSGEKITQPIAYDGQLNDTYDILTSISDVKAMCFHFVSSDEELQDVSMKSEGAYKVTISTYFTVNLGLIYPENTGTIQYLIQEIKNLIWRSKKPYPSGIHFITPKKVVYNNLDNVFKPFTSQRLFPQIFKYPNRVFRIDFEVRYNFCC